MSYAIDSLLYIYGLLISPHHWAIICVVLLIEVTIKPVTWLQQLPYHPVMSFGYIITMLHKVIKPLYSNGLYNMYQRIFLYIYSGIIIMIALLSVYLITFIITIIADMHIILYYSIHIILCSWLLAGADLHDAVKRIALGKNIDEKRYYLSHIVSRDTSVLSRSSIYRSSLESLSENFSDGFMAPLLYYIVFGLYGMMIYKMINTLDSMIGYTYKPYKYIGYMAAKIDDGANFIPARLSALYMVVFGAILYKQPMGTMWRIIKRDAPYHPSPNGGVVESAFASAIQCKLGGPRTYNNSDNTPHHIVDHWIAKEYPNPDDKIMLRSLSFFYYLMVVNLCIGSLILLIVIMT